MWFARWREVIYEGEDFFGRNVISVSRARGSSVARWGENAVPRVRQGNASGIGCDLGRTADGRTEGFVR